MMLMYRACEHDGRCRDEKANVHAMRPCETSRALGDPNGMTLARPSPAMVAERSWAWASAVNLELVCRHPHVRPVRGDFSGARAFRHSPDLQPAHVCFICTWPSFLL